MNHLSRCMLRRDVKFTNDLFSKESYTSKLLLTRENFRKIATILLLKILLLSAQIYGMSIQARG
jgi:hypothetical protein